MLRGLGPELRRHPGNVFSGVPHIEVGVLGDRQRRVAGDHVPYRLILPALVAEQKRVELEVVHKGGLKEVALVEPEREGEVHQLIEASLLEGWVRIGVGHPILAPRQGRMEGDTERGSPAGGPGTEDKEVSFSISELRCEESLRRFRLEIGIVKILGRGTW